LAAQTHKVKLKWTCQTK